MLPMSITSSFTALAKPISWKVILAYVLGTIVLDTTNALHPLLPLALSPWNPPPGLNLAFLLLYGVHYWPWLFAAAFLTQSLIHGWPPIWPTDLVGAVLLALCYAFLSIVLVHVARIKTRFRSLHDLSWFLATVAVGLMLIGLVYIGTRALGGDTTQEEFLLHLVEFWVADFIRLIVVTPLLLVHIRTDWRNLKPNAEMVMQVVSIFFTLWVIFGITFTDEFKFFYLLFLPLIWIAMRHGIEGATLALLTTHLGLNTILYWRGHHALTVVEFQMLMLGLAITSLFLGMTVTIRRIAEDRLHQREAELNQALRLAAAGEMAQALAHELNQPLAALTNYANAGRAMLAEGNSGPLLASTLEKLAKEANRAGQVMHRLRDFFRGGALRLQAVTVDELIEEGLAPLRKRAEKLGILVRITVAPGLPAAMADRIQIGTVLHNLIRNAIDSLASSKTGWREIEIWCEREGEQQVRLCVSDSGSGISEEMAGHLFEPFFTSKSHGMGLGLAISRTLVEAHGGELHLESNQPARFCFTLPVAHNIPASNV